MPPPPGTVLRDALLALAARPAAWRALATPGVGAGVDVTELPAAILDPLVDAGLVEVAGDRAGPRLPMVLRDGRPYLMSLRPGGEGDAYTQDVWPETDALLARVAAAPPGTLLEVGTGSGAVCIEAARRGHVATGTDLFADALELAAWNAALHGVSVELLPGHMLEPVRGRRFDLVLSAPHYGQTADLLRVEMLRDGVHHVGRGGALFVVTFLEWEDDRVGVVDALLRPMAERGAAVSVRPFPRGPLARWFRVPDPPTPGVPARHRFAIEIRPDGPPGLDVRLPPDDTVERERLVPLSRRAPDSRATATITAGEDLAALGAILDELASGTVRLDARGPLLDACRFGAERCATAHGAIVELGGVRPCGHGQRLGTTDDTSRGFHARVLAAVAAAEERRGCATCVARAVCSRCAFPTVDDAAYCDFVRRHHAQLPALHRVLALRNGDHADAARFAVKLAPGGPLLVARHRPPVAQGTTPHELSPIAGWIWASRGALVVADDEIYLHLGHDLDQAPLELAPEAAELVELLLDGCAPDALRAYAETRDFGARPGVIDALVAVVAGWVTA